MDPEAFTCPKPLRSVFGAVERCTDFNTSNIDADLVHCHTWYSPSRRHPGEEELRHSAGITVHSLEPLRPWKREQLGGGYDFTVWLEKTAIEMADAVIAVSRGDEARHRALFNIEPERVHVIYNGIDLDEYRKAETTDALDRTASIREKPFVLFVGRITRQKGIIHLVRAIQHMADGFQIVLCAGAPDTPEIGQEMEKAVAEVSRKRPGVIWVREMVDKKR